jgi:uncharacterized damage-inducible protein DinB
MPRHEALLDSWEWERATTVRVIAAVPARRAGWRPHRKNMTAGQLARHLVASEWWFLTGAAGLRMRGNAPAATDGKPTAPAAVAREAAAVHRRLAAAVRRKGDDWLDAEVDFYGMRMTRARLLGLMVRHEVHHRGQLSVYIRLAGGKVPSIYGPSADTPFDADGKPLE